MTTLGEFHKCARSNIPILERCVKGTSWNLIKFSGPGIPQIGTHVVKIVIAMENTWGTFVNALKFMKLPSVEIIDQGANAALFYVCDLKQARTINACPKSEKDFHKWRLFVASLVDRALQHGMIQEEVHLELTRLNRFTMVFLMWFLNRPDLYKKRNKKWVSLMVERRRKPIASPKVKIRDVRPEINSLEQRISKARLQLNEVADEVTGLTGESRDWVLEFMVNTSDMNQIGRFTSYKGESYQGDNMAKRILTKTNKLSDIHAQIGTMMRRKRELSTLVHVSPTIHEEPLAAKPPTPPWLDKYCDDFERRQDKGCDYERSETSERSERSERSEQSDGAF